MPKLCTQRGCACDSPLAYGGNTAECGCFYRFEKKLLEHVARTFQDHDKVRRERRGMMPKANPFVELLWNASIRAEHYSLVSKSPGNHKFVIQGNYPAERYALSGSEGEIHSSS